MPANHKPTKPTKRKLILDKTDDDEQDYLTGESEDDDASESNSDKWQIIQTTMITMIKAHWSRI